MHKPSAAHGGAADDADELKGTVPDRQPPARPSEAGVV
jgi:hypothetical protein